MARCTMKMPEEFLLKISRLGDKTDDVCGRVLNAGAEVVLKKVRTNLRNVISKDTKRSHAQRVSLNARSACPLFYQTRTAI